MLFTFLDISPSTLIKISAGRLRTYHFDMRAPRQAIVRILQGVYKQGKIDGGSNAQPYIKDQHEKGIITSAYLAIRAILALPK